MSNDRISINENIFTECPLWKLSDTLSKFSKLLLWNFLDDQKSDVSCCEKLHNRLYEVLTNYLKIWFRKIVDSEKTIIKKNLSLLKIFGTWCKKYEKNEPPTVNHYHVSLWKNWVTLLLEPSVLYHLFNHMTIFFFSKFLTFKFKYFLNYFSRKIN